jgi:hypothetical protein
MFNISSYLEKFKKIEPEGDSAKRATEKAIFETLGVRVERKDMSVRNNTLHISATASLKNEIFMNKGGILKKAQSGVRRGDLGDIR